MAKTNEYGIGQYTFPRGWFMVGEAAEATNKPSSLRYFGRDLDNVPWSVRACSHYGCLLPAYENPPS